MTAFPDLGRLAERLSRDFPLLGEETIRAVVAEVAEEYRDARVVQYVGIFVEREARDRLARGAVPNPRGPHDRSPVA